jgi:hypothetical protein
LQELPHPVFVADCRGDQHAVARALLQKQIENLPLLLVTPPAMQPEKSNHCRCASIAIDCVNRAAAFDEESRHGQIVRGHGDVKRGVGDRVDLSDTIRFFRQECLHAIDLAFEHGLTNIGVIEQRTVTPLDGGQDGLRNGEISSFAKLLCPIPICVLMILAREFVGHGVCSHVQKCCHELFVSVPGRDPKRRPYAGFGIKKAVIVVRGVQDLGMRLQQSGDAVNITVSAGIVKFLNFLKAGIHVRAAYPSRSLHTTRRMPVTARGFPQS